jgi:peptidoglycan/LPS O-acetylase OafA/YrhL
MLRPGVTARSSRNPTTPNEIETLIVWETASAEVPPNRMRADGPIEAPSLTGLRGLAALVVLLFHVNLLLDPHMHLQAGAVCTAGATGVERGYLAVDFFFMLSGFVMLHVYGLRFSGAGPPNTWPFYRARIARIFPVHLATTALFVPFFLYDRSYSATGLIATVFLVQPWVWSQSWNQGSWSISAEWHAYLLFPLLARHIMRNSAASALTLGICSGLIVASLLGFIGCGNIASSPLLLGRALPEFIIGTAAYRIFISGAARGALGTDAAALAIAASIILISETGANDLFIVVLLPALLLSCVYNNREVNRALNSSLSLYLGRISYSLYLGQGVVMIALLTIKPLLPDALSSPVSLACAFAVFSMAFATALSRWLEYPARDLVRKALGDALRLE